MFGLGPMEIVLVIFVILLVFGAKRIPEIAHGIGKGILEFKKALRDVPNESDTAFNSKNPPVRNERKDQRISDRPHETADQANPEDKREG
jgi:TatA/E family protein of Tat protein translocase